jgi:hypothetical protein
MELAFVIPADSQFGCEFVRLEFACLERGFVSLMFDDFESEGFVNVPLYLFGCCYDGFMTAKQEQRSFV